MLSRFEWKPGLDGFGGISGLEIYEDGRTFLAIGDRGLVVSGTFRGNGGRIDGVEITRLDRMKNPNGVPPIKSDGEGLALLPGGGYAVSLEGDRPNLWRYDTMAAAANPHKRTDWMRALRENGGMEALAWSAEHGLITIAEHPEADGFFPIRALADGDDGWRVIGQIEQNDGLNITGADIGPDGALYILERSVGLRGFRSRIRRWNGGEAEILFSSEAGEFDNLEAIDVRADPRDSDRILVVLISDDNFLFLQKTEIVVLRLTL